MRATALPGPALLVPAMLGLSLLAGPASAAPASCAAIADAAGDVEVAPGATVPDGHVDLRKVGVAAGRTGLTFTITDTAIDAHRLGEWRVFFASGSTRLYVAAGRGTWVNAGDSSGNLAGFQAGVVGRDGTNVSGRFDEAAGTITVTAPYAVFGRALRSRHAVLTALSARAVETFAYVAPSAAVPATPVAFTDHATRADALDLSRCG